MKTVNILMFNGKKFARTSTAFVSSLFDPTGTCVGFFRLQGNGVLLMDHQENPVAYIVNHQYRERFIVTAFKDPTGRTAYMHGTTSVTDRFLGLDQLSYSQKGEVAASAIDQLATAGEAAQDAL